MDSGLKNQKKQLQRQFNTTKPNQVDFAASIVISKSLYCVKLILKETVHLKSIFTMPLVGYLS